MATEEKTYYGTKGDEFNLELRQGATSDLYSVVYDKDGSPVNLAGATFKAQIAKTPDGPVITGAAATVTVVDASDGEFEFYFSSDATALLSADPDDEFASDSAYVWGLDMYASDGAVTPLLYGDVAVFRNVPKE